MIGGYRIIRMLGEGGMGAVYEAEQDRPRRSVALKVIRGVLASTELKRRFERESQTLGRLHHSGIAQIYEAGSAETGFGVQPFFAMELIHGKSLVQYAEEHKLDIRQRLELMIKVCEAVQHAHERGIVHRDLKPGNILVDENGQPKILDFGLARATDADAQMTQQTVAGQILGTLAYMSPEQVLGDPLAVDTRSDIYALGVILYELLAKKLPYALSNVLHAAVETIRVTEPPQLSSVNRAFRGDVETIVGKALEKEKARRYASAAELAADIGRFLHDEPIVARPPSTTYRIAKFARRHRVLVASTAIIFLVLVCGIAISTWQAVKARRAQREAEKQAAIAQAVTDFLRNDLLGQASAYQQSDPDIKVRTALDRAAAKVNEKFKNQPEVQMEILDTIGMTYGGMGVYPKAEKMLAQATGMARQIYGLQDPKIMRPILHQIRAEEDVKNFTEADRLATEILGAIKLMKHPDPKWALEARSDLIFDAREQGNLALAETLSRQLLDEEKRIFPPDDDAIQDEVNELGNVYGLEGKFAEAEPLIRQLLAIRQRVHGLEDPSTLWSMSNLAWNYRLQGRFAEAEKLHRQCFSLRSRVLGPNNADTASSLFNLAEVLWLERKLPEARALFRTVLQGDPNDTTMSVITWFELTILPMESQDTKEALKLARRAASLAPNDPNGLETFALAEARNQLWDEANVTIKKSIQLNTGNDSDYFFILAMIDNGRGKMADAQDHYAHAVESAGKLDLTNNPSLRRLWAETAQVLGKPQPEH